MEKESEILGQIAIQVELFPSVALFAAAEEEEGQEFARHLLQFLNGLAADLGVPAKICPSIRTGAVEPEAGTAGAVEPEGGTAPFRVLISGSECRLPLYPTAPGVPQPKELAASIAQAVYRNRELLVDATLSKRIRREWSANNVGTQAPGLQLEEFHKFISSVVSRGFNINRAQAAYLEAGGKSRIGWSAEHYFDAAISGLDTTTIKVIVDKDRNTLGSSAPSDERPLSELFEEMQGRLFSELGIMIPTVQTHAGGLDENEFRFQINDVRLPPTAGLTPEQFLVDASPDTLTALGLKGRAALNPETGADSAIVENKNGALEACKKNGFTTFGPAKYIELSLAGEIRRSAGSFLTGDLLRYTVSRLEEAWPTLVNGIVERFDVTFVARILRALLDEEVSIKNLPAILESLLAVVGTSSLDHSTHIVFHSNPPDLCPVADRKKVESLTADDYANCARMALKQQLSYEYTRGKNTLLVYTLAPAIETELAEGKELSGDSNRLTNPIFNKVKNRPPGAQRPVILTTLPVRQRLRSLIEKERPWLAVVCRHELLPEVNIQTIARIEVT